MKQRVITGLIFGIIIIGAFFLMNTIFFPIFIAFLSGMAVWETEKAVGLKNLPIMVFSIAVSVMIPFLFEFGVSLPVGAFGGIYVVLILIFMLLQYSKTRFQDAITAIFASVCIPYAFSLMIVFRDLPEYIDGYTKKEGLFFLIFALVASWMTDIFAYFTGSKLGKHKLCPNISPKKSVEGAIGGVVGAMLFNILLLFIFKRFVFEAETGLSYIGVALISVVLSVVSMFGDLAASTIKRNFGIKDFGKILPGHGGIMDRFDSVLFVLPVLYSAVYLLNSF